MNARQAVFHTAWRPLLLPIFGEIVSEGYIITTIHAICAGDMLSFLYQPVSRKTSSGSGRAAVVTQFNFTGFYPHFLDKSAKNQPV